MKLEIIELEIPNNCNIVLGTAHFIKTVEDIYEALVNTVPSIKFGVGFCEASGPCLVRSEGNHEELKKLAETNAYRLGCGHSFVILLKNAFPINILSRIKMVPEVCTIHAATSNSLEVIVVETDQGKGILGVIDGSKTKGVETEKDVIVRKKFLRKLGYKL
ncbi:adenosine-specific kinase [Candidatus Bathyarchaeota archaeon]|nr:adenosine-specific kinase [Candidatus Bathyarchaeota archaeon]